MESLAAGQHPGDLIPGAVSSSKVTQTKKPPEGGFCAGRTESLLAPSVFTDAYWSCASLVVLCDFETACHECSLTNDKK